MMKSGAPPDTFGVLYRLLPIEFHDFTNRIYFLGLSLFDILSYLIFREVMGPFRSDIVVITF